jgi:hypothetical protein
MGGLTLERSFYRETSTLNTITDAYRLICGRGHAN